MKIPRFSRWQRRIRQTAQGPDDRPRRSHGRGRLRIRRHCIDIDDDGRDVVTSAGGVGGRDQGLTRVLRRGLLP